MVTPFKGTAKLPSKRAVLALMKSPMRTTDYAKVSPMNATDRNSAMGKALRKEK